MSRFKKVSKFFTFLAVSIVTLGSSAAYAAETAVEGLDVSGFQIDLAPLNDVMAVLLTALGAIWVLNAIIRFTKK